MKRYLTLIAFSLVLGFAGVAVAQENAVQSDNALAYLSIDIENSPGWVAKVKGGYQWKLFRHVGINMDGFGGTASNLAHSKNYTKDGVAASAMLGYNFGRFPLTVGFELGYGPSGKMSQRTLVGADSMYSHQKVKIYTLDLTADYDFKNCSRWTPFVSITAGAAFVSQRGHATVDNAAGQSTGSMGKRKQVNFMTGARAGVKYEITKCLTLSLYGSYNYLGKVHSKTYAVTGDAGNWNARTRKITAHSIDVKAGLTMKF